jgi:hypothetical protein
MQQLLGRSVVLCSPWPGFGSVAGNGAPWRLFDMDGKRNESDGHWMGNRKPVW